MSHFVPGNGENCVTSSKHMNGYFLEPEALGGRRNSQCFLCPSFTLSKHCPFWKFEYIHILLKIETKNLDSCRHLKFFVLLLTSQKAVS